jgi:hypothetical protein
LSPVEDIKRKWEEWYGDLMAHYQWNELEYNGRTVLYVCGTAVIDVDGRGFASSMLQVIGCADGAALNGDEEAEIAGMLRKMHGTENVSFWSY